VEKRGVAFRENFGVGARFVSWGRGRDLGFGRRSDQAKWGTRSLWLTSTKRWQLWGAIESMG